MSFSARSSAACGPWAVFLELGFLWFVRLSWGFRLVSGLVSRFFSRWCFAFEECFVWCAHAVDILCNPVVPSE